MSVLARHSRVIGALMMREMTTRFGREGLGFLWLIGEPLVFCFGVMLMWTLTKPAYEHGVRIAPFVMTGYMCLLLVRHHMGMSLGALQANIGLMYHRQIRPFHVFIARNFLEFMGNTMAFIVVYVILIILGQVSPPGDWLLLYAGWALLGWMSFGLGLLVAGMAMRFELFERVSNLISYLMIPISGVFFMVAWLPANVREIYMWVPFPHAVEMIRAAVFGEFVPTYYNPVYALAVGTIMVLFGLAAISGAEHAIDIE